MFLFGLVPPEAVPPREVGLMVARDYRLCPLILDGLDWPFVVGRDSCLSSGLGSVFKDSYLWKQSSHRNSST